MLFEVLGGCEKSSEKVSNFTPYDGPVFRYCGWTEVLVDDVTMSFIDRTVLLHGHVPAIIKTTDTIMTFRREGEQRTHRSTIFVLGRLEYIADLFSRRSLHDLTEVRTSIDCPIAL